ncbi:autotransporter domain-containing protein, partial [Fusobacterium varium]|nr:autotransporter domain-containing protein [Fusobacterium varium]
MIETIIKAVKRGNKKRGRNITIGTVIGFLLSCTAVMGATSDNYLWIKKENNEEIKFNKTATTGNEGSWNEGNPYSNNNWVKKTYTNNIALSSNGANGKDGGVSISYGLRLSGNLTGVNFINNGSIIGEMSGSGYVFGIYNTGTIGDITNVGIISGTVKGNGTGNGNGIYNSGTMENITNGGVINGTGTGAGAGIYNSGAMENITNTGLISGTVKDNGSGTGFGTGIYNLDTMENITNTGIISGTVKGSGTGFGTGIYNSGTMENITNTGLISGTVKGNSSGKGYGITNYSTSTMRNITNTGIISGYGSSSGEGYGIYNKSTMGKITNTGVIYGTNNAIKNDKSDNITVNNYGILVNGKNQDVNAGSISSNNYGLIIKNEGESITIRITGTQDISIPFYDAEENIMGERKVTIGNIAEKNENKSNSFSGNKENHILNALTNTYKVTGENDKVTGSIINAYGTAVVFGDTGDKELTLSGTIVNGGIEDSTNGIAISGSNNGDTLILQSGEIEYKINEEKKSATQNTVV